MSDHNGFRAAEWSPLNKVAELLGCSRQTVYRLIEADQLEGVQLSDHGWWRVRRQSLKRYLERLASKRRSRGPQRARG
jgi:excisionase family DNA binding protein